MTGTIDPAAIRPADVRAVARACRRTLDLDGGDPPGYASLGVAVLHAVWSVRAQPTALTRVVADYAAFLGVRPAPLGARERGGEHTVTALHATIEGVGGPERFAADVVRHRQPTSTRNGILKAEACLRAAEALLDNRIDRRRDLLRRLPADGARAAWMAVPGQGSGLSWSTLLTLSGVEGIQPDPLVRAFAAEALDRPVTEGEAAELLTVAHALLAEDHPALSPRALGHALRSARRSR